MTESIELATILLTDLVGSTRLATAVGPSRADELREEHFALLREAVAVHGGREGKNTGDGLMISFASASVSVRCAVLMQQLFERRYRGAEEGLHIRIGLGAGESTVKDGDYFGMPSIEAARLCAEAPADGILASASVKLLAGHIDGVELASVGAVELKGFPDPVEAFSVLWAPFAEEGGDAGEAGAWPLPALLRSVPTLSYVGRTAERAALEGALTQARNGARQVVSLCGEPGIGKSRLASHSAHHAHAQGFAVSWGSCSEELAVPYEPWMEACSQLVEHAPQELLAAHVQRHGGELSRLARNLRDRAEDLPAPQPSDPETERYLLFSAVTGLLSEVARELPVCLVLDDMHWADAQSIALLKHLARTVEHEPLLVIVTYRDSDLGKDHALSAVLADLRRIEGVERIALRGLEGGEVTQIMTGAAGHELDEDGVRLAGEIAAETDGNPFFVGEMLRSLLESGALVLDEASGRWSVDRSEAIALPESVREVVERRVERLGEDAVEVLTVAAVVGRAFDLELLSAVVEMDETRLLDQLEAAVAASVLSESTERVGRFRFVHALINQTLYEGLGATRRARTHQRVAEALEVLYGADPGDHLAELALHWRLAAVSVDKPKAADYALKAGQRALEKLAPGEAIKLFSDAVELSGDGDSHERCAALIGFGVAQRQTGDPAHRETLLEASRLATSLRRGDLAAAAALANHRAATGSAYGVVDQERVAAIERAIELDQPPTPARRARLVALQAQELSWDPDFARRQAVADEALALARSAGDRRVLADVLQPVFVSIWTAETLGLRAQLAAELVAIAEELQDPAVELEAQHISCNAHVELGEFAAARAAVERWRTLAEELGQPTKRWLSTYSAAALELLRGHFDAGERLAGQAFQIGQEPAPTDAAQVYGAQLGFIRRYQGRGNEVIERQEQAVSAHPGIVAWRAGLAMSWCWLDRHDEARAILDAGAGDRFDHVTPNLTGLAALALYADAAAQARHADAAAALSARMEPFAEQIVWMSVQGYGHVRLWLGLLAGVAGEHERARGHLAFACEFHEVNDLPLWAARGRLGWAEMLAAQGDAAGAREQAAVALVLAQEHGYGAFEKRAAALASAQSPH